MTKSETDRLLRGAERFLKSLTLYKHLNDSFSSKELYKSSGLLHHRGDPGCGGSSSRQQTTVFPNRIKLMSKVVVKIPTTEPKITIRTMNAKVRQKDFSFKLNF